MFKKTSVLLIIFGIAVCSVSIIQAQETTIGAHVKLTLYDYKDGKSNGVVEFPSRGLYSFIAFSILQAVIRVEPGHKFYLVK